MIECDSCKKKMYADSRSKQGKDYHEIWIDKEDVYHVCDECYMKILQSHFPEIYDYIMNILAEV